MPLTKLGCWSTLSKAVDRSQEAAQTYNQLQGKRDVPEREVDVGGFFGAFCPLSLLYFLYLTFNHGFRGGE